MRYVDEFRDEDRTRALREALRRATTRPWVVMEVCGGQTHAILKNGLDAMLPEGLKIVHGPGCPVCVTPLELIDRAHRIARRPGVVMTSFGDMLRVPGSEQSLLGLRAHGADVRVVYSPLDAVELARRMPDREVVYFAVGFETTAPATAMALHQARRLSLGNFSALVSHLLMPPVMAAVLQAPGNRVDAYLGPGHAATISGLGEYELLSRRYRVPIVITGFEPTDLLEGLLRLVRQLEEGRAEVENQYARTARPSGNLAAKELLEEVFEVCDRPWRGLGSVPKSGLRLAHAYRELDAERRFEVDDLATREPAECQSGLVLKGMIKPSQCPAFGTRCTPERPLGATMVSAEGACAAYYRYRRHQAAAS
jgi:hydrogenase expression/formation protein HypD